MVIGHAVHSYPAEQILNLHYRMELHAEVAVHQVSSISCVIMIQTVQKRIYVQC